MDQMIEHDLRKEIEQLPPPLQRKVVDYAHSLVQSIPRGASGKDLLQFAGTMSQTDATEMNQAIKEGCEGIETNEW